MPVSEDDCDFEQGAVRSFRSTHQGSHFQEDTQFTSFQREASRRKWDRFEGLDMLLKSKSLERLPSSYKSRDKDYEFTMASTSSAGRKFATNSQQKAALKPVPAPTTGWDEDFKNVKSLVTPTNLQLVETAATCTTKPMRFSLHETKGIIKYGDSNCSTSMGASYSVTPLFKSSASGICTLSERVNKEDLKRKWEEPILCHGNPAAEKIRSAKFDDSAGYVKVDVSDEHYESL